MSYHHYNRLLAHWRPVRKPEGVSLTWGSKERYTRLTVSSRLVATVVCGHLNDETNSYPISNKTLIEKTYLSKGALTKALAELVEWGIFTRTRANNESPYVYALSVSCPPDCEKFEIHNTQSELATWPTKQSSPRVAEQARVRPTEQARVRPTEQARVTPGNRRLIDSDKQQNRQTNRNTSSICPSCEGEEYFDKVIHKQECPQYQNLKTFKPWKITQERNPHKWAGWDYRQKQMATFDSLREYVEKNNLKAQERMSAFNKMLDEQAGEQILLPRWRDWLQLRVEAFNLAKIAFADLNLALEHSAEGRDLDERCGWKQSPHSQPLSYYSKSVVELDEVF
jgi:DNA-binding HxlR family transcriptional regulator